VFEPFFTTKGLDKGTGLGLASAYGIIKAHGGYLDVESQEGHGTSFFITLPLAKAPPDTKKPSVRETSRGSETILLVDDEEVVLEVAKEMIKTLGYTVLTASNGADAVQVYQAMGDQIDMVILDMIMPGMGGAETYERLTVLDRKVKVLLSSGYSIDGKATDILNKGCDGFIQKPFNLKKLSQKIRDVLEGDAETLTV
jgi:CheY-like chemotaxis protein